VDVPVDMQIYKDPNTSLTFYYNPQTGVSVWEKPYEDDFDDAAGTCESDEVHEVNELADLGV
jgi:hypothetical protein